MSATAESSGYLAVQTAADGLLPASKTVLFEVVWYLASPELAELVCLYAIPIVEFNVPTTDSVTHIWRFDSTVKLRDMMCRRGWRLSVSIPGSGQGLTVMLVYDECTSGQGKDDKWFCSSTVGVHRPVVGCMTKHVLFKEKNKPCIEYDRCIIGEKSRPAFEFTDQVLCMVENCKREFGPTNDFKHHFIRIEIGTSEDITAAPTLEFTATYL